MTYEIKGNNLPVVICNLKENEKMITEKGSMCWMSPNIVMKTNTGGGIGKAISKMFSGESIFQNVFTSKDSSGLIAFASSFPGAIKAIEIKKGNELIVQKSSFLASEENVELSIHFQKKIGAGFFGGEGFIMQKLSGEGTAFIEIDGSEVEYELEKNQSIVIDTGYLVAMDSSCEIEIKAVVGIKNMLLGGDGIFNTIVTGPGKVILQTLPITKLASSIQPFLQIQGAEN